MKKAPKDGVADGYYRKLIRCRAGWRCQYVGRIVLNDDRPIVCGAYVPPGNARLHLHTSHILSRNRRATRWHPLNAFSICASHHAHLGMNPLEHAILAKTLLGEKDYEYLLELGRLNIQLKRHHKIELVANLKASWEFMQAGEEAGDPGDFEDPLPEGLI